jgi:hypothetical protein
VCEREREREREREGGREGGRARVSEKCIPFNKECSFAIHLQKSDRIIVEKMHQQCHIKECTE